MVDALVYKAEKIEINQEMIKKRPKLKISTKISRLPEPYPNNFLNLFCRPKNEFDCGLQVSHEDEDFR